MVKIVSKTKGWEFIPEQQKEIIRDSLIKIKDPKLDRRDYLDILFEMYNLYMGGNYPDSGKTCGTCVNNVLKSFQTPIDKENGK